MSDRCLGIVGDADDGARADVVSPGGQTVVRWMSDGCHMGGS